MTSETGDEKESFWDSFGLDFNFGPGWSNEIAQNGQVFRGEYGLYKYTSNEDKEVGEKFSSVTVCFISDDLVPVGLIHVLGGKGDYSVHCYKFRLDLPWKMKDGNRTFHLSSSKSYEYVKIMLYETPQKKEVPPLIQKAIEFVIDQTEQELAVGN